MTSKKILLLPLVCSLGLAQDRALLATVSRYGEGFPPLHGVSHDMERAKQMALRMNFAAANTEFLEEATTAQIMHGVDRLRQETTSSSRVLIYLSMHGGQVPDVDGDETVDHRDEVLITSDTRIVNGAPRNFILDDHINEWLTAIPARNILVIIDSCNSGSMEKGIGSSNPEIEVKSVGYFPKAGPPGSTPFRGSSTKDISRDPGPQRTFVVLAASGEQESAYGSPSQGSFFTLALEETSRQSPSSIDAWMRETEKRMRDFHVSQTPQMKSERSGDELDWFKSNRRTGYTR